MRGKGTKLGEGKRDLEGERAILGIITFEIITIFGIWDYSVRDCFAWEKFVAPSWIGNQMTADGKRNPNCRRYKAHFTYLGTTVPCAPQHFVVHLCAPLL